MLRHAEAEEGTKAGVARASSIAFDVGDVCLVVASVGKRDADGLALRRVAERVCGVRSGRAGSAQRRRETRLGAEEVLGRFLDLGPFRFVRGVRENTDCSLGRL